MASTRPEHTVLAPSSVGGAGVLSPILPLVKAALRSGWDGLASFTGPPLLIREGGSGEERPS
eukprot:11660582-Alexandrium_andersonii.AAC.1